MLTTREHLITLLFWGPRLKERSVWEQGTSHREKNLDLNIIGFCLPFFWTFFGLLNVLVATAISFLVPLRVAFMGS